MLSSFRPLSFVLAALVLAVGLSSRAAASTTKALAVSKLILVDTDTQKVLRELTGGSTINLAVDGSALNVRADVTGTVGSVGFFLNGKLFHTENGAPFALRGDHNGMLIKWTPAIGSYTLRVVPYASQNLKGSGGKALEIKFKVTDIAPTVTAPEVTKLVLVNTKTQQTIRELKTGGEINLAVDGKNLSVRADIDGKAGSVAFTLNGKLLHTANSAPFALAGDRDGVLINWTPTVGSHKLRVAPYSSKDRTGASGIVAAVDFQVTNVVAGSDAVEPGSPLPTTPSNPSPARSVLYKADGTLDLSLYGLLALSYDKDTMEMRLGPSFLDLSPTAPDDRPTLFQPTSKTRTSGYIRTNPYELGSNPKTDGDYWSESGQVGYVPDSVNDAGLDRIQVYAYYDRVFAISPRLDWASGKPHPDPQTRDPYYAQIFGQAPKHPIAMVRNYGQQTNEALVLYREGYLAVVGTQTSRAGKDRPYPGFTFPTNKIPTAIAVTTSNEFALVTIWDTSTRQGQLAVFALEAKYIPFHTWGYMGMPNQGSWSAFKLLGYVDLPMATPTSVAAASNGWWSGPSQTGGLVLSQIDLGLDKHRKHIYDGIWKAVVARNGYAIVASQYDNKVAIVDLSALFAYMRESYLSSIPSFKATLAARGTGAKDFPQTFSERPSITPTVVMQTDVPTPTTVLAGLRLDRWSKDHFKAYVASRDGTIRIIDTSSIMQRYEWERRGALRVVGSFNVGRNPVSMCFTRRSEKNLPLIPIASDGTQSTPDTLNNMLYIAVRGDRKVVAAVTYNGAGAVYKTIKDKRMGDPVAVSTAIRGPILSVADFRGKKMLSFRVGKINDLRNKVLYGCGPDGNDPFEFTGQVPFNGYPFLINTTNVN
jgi:hypothetical protein